MPTATSTNRQRPRATPRPAWHAARTIPAAITILLAPQIAVGQSTPSVTAARHTRASTQPASLASSPDLQGIWDFEMRAGERTSPGFFALGPVEQQWAGSITMYLTNTLAIRSLTVTGDSVRMVVASREGDVRFLARLTDNGRVMEGIVEYHGGALLPMTATRRLRPVVSR